MIEYSINNSFKKMMYIIGFLAQLCFSARLVVQWIMSEKAKQSVSPSIFWIFSLLGSFLFFFYGWLRDDFAIILGQLISYYIYIWNLDIKNNWKKLPRPIRHILIATPFLVVGYMISEIEQFYEQFFQNEEIPIGLLIWGSAGQVIFTLRFVYQWIYSQKRKASILPMGFWLISLIGSSIIVSYAIFRRDPVLFIGQLTGFIVYGRNLWLIYRQSQNQLKG